MHVKKLDEGYYYRSPLLIRGLRKPSSNRNQCSDDITEMNQSIAAVGYGGTMYSDEGAHHLHLLRTYTVLRK